MFTLDGKDLGALRESLAELRMEHAVTHSDHGVKRRLLGERVRLTEARIAGLEAEEAEAASPGRFTPEQLDHHVAASTKHFRNDTDGLLHWCMLQLRSAALVLDVAETLATEAGDSSTRERIAVRSSGSDMTASVVEAILRERGFDVDKHKPKEEDDEH